MLSDMAIETLKNVSFKWKLVVAGLLSLGYLMWHCYNTESQALLQHVQTPSVTIEHASLLSDAWNAYLYGPVIDGSVGIERLTRPETGMQSRGIVVSSQALIQLPVTALIGDDSQGILTIFKDFASVGRKQTNPYEYPVHGLSNLESITGWGVRGGIISPMDPDTLVFTGLNIKRFEGTRATDHPFFGYPYLSDRQGLAGLSARVELAVRSDSFIIMPSLGVTYTDLISPESFTRETSIDARLGIETRNGSAEYAARWTATADHSPNLEEVTMGLRLYRPGALVFQVLGATGRFTPTGANITIRGDMQLSNQCTLYVSCGLGSIEFGGSVYLPNVNPFPIIGGEQ